MLTKFAGWFFYSFLEALVRASQGKKLAGTITAA